MWMLHHSGMGVAYHHQLKFHSLRSCLAVLWNLITVHSSAEAEVVCSSAVAFTVAAVISVAVVVAL